MPQHRTEKVWTVVVAGGSSQRFGRPKQYELLGDMRILDRSMATARAASDGVVLVVPSVDTTIEGGEFVRLQSPLCLSYHPKSPLTTEEVLERAAR